MRSFSSSRPIGTKLTATAFLLLTAIPANAGVIADRPTWLTQVTGVTTYTFGTQTAGTTVGFNTISGLTATTAGLSSPIVLAPLGISLVGIDPTSGGGYTFSVVQGSSTVASYYDWGSGAIGRSAAYANGFAAPSIRVTFTGGPVTAFAIDLGTGGVVPPGNVTVTPLGLGSTILTTQARGTFTFYGITSSTPFSSVDITAPSTASAYEVIDNISYGTYNSTPPPDPTPELASILAVATGLIFLAKLKSKSVQQTA